MSQVTDGESSAPPVVSQISRSNGFVSEMAYDFDELEAMFDARLEEKKEEDRRDSESVVSEMSTTSIRSFKHRNILEDAASVASTEVDESENEDLKQKLRREKNRVMDFLTHKDERIDELDETERPRQNSLSSKVRRGLQALASNSTREKAKEVLSLTQLKTSLKNYSAKGIVELRKEFFNDFESEGSVEEEDFEFANIQVVVDENKSESKQVRSGQRRFPFRRKRPRRVSIASSNAKKVEKKLSFNTRVMNNLKLDQESESFEYSKEDIDKKIKNTHQLISKSKNIRSRSPQEGDRTLDLYYSSFALKKLRRRTKDGEVTARIGKGIARKKRLKQKSKLDHNYRKKGKSKNKEEVDYHLLSKNQGLNLSPKFLVMYFAIPLLLIGSSGMIRLMMEHWNLLATPDGLDQKVQASDYVLPPLLTALLPEVYHDVLNQRVLFGTYVMRVGGMLVILNSLSTAWKYFSLLRPKTELVAREKSSKIM